MENDPWKSWKVVEKILAWKKCGNDDTGWAYVAVSGAGKTYTMLGRDDNPGIMAHALTELFTQMKRTKDEHVYKVSMSYLEVRSRTSSVQKQDN